MSLIVPFSQKKLDDTQDIIAISSNEFAPYIAFLSASSIYIRDIDHCTTPIKESFTRSAESLKNSGRNSWIQWFNKITLFYGTSSGTIYMSYVGSLNNVKELFISKVILSSFVCHNNLAVTTATSQIYFINSNCEINFYVTLFDIPRGIRHCTFHPPTTLSCIVDGEPYFISIDKDSFSKKYEPIAKRIPVSNVNFTALSLKQNLLAISKEDEEILLINISPKKCPPIVAYKKEQDTEKDFVVCMFWTMNESCLIVIKESGKIIIWSYSTYEIKIENEISSAICFDFEQRTHRLYWSNMKEIQFVTFSAILDHYAMNSDQLIDLFKKDSNNNYEVIFSDPENIFPLIFLAASENHFAVGSLKKFSIDGKKTIEMEIVGLTFFNGLLAVFEIDPQIMKYYLNFYEIKSDKNSITDAKETTNNESNFDVNLIKKVTFPFFPRQISIFQNEMVVLGNSKFCKIKITDEKVDRNTNDNDDDEDDDDDGANCNVLGESYNNELVYESGLTRYFSLVTEGFCCQLLSCFITKKDCLALLLESNDVLIAPDGPYFCKNVDSAWSFNEGELPLVFMHTGQSTIISCFMEKVRVESFPIFTDGYRMFNLKAKMVGLGKLEFESRCFGHFFLAHLAGQISEENSEDDPFSVLNNFYQKRFPSEYPKILADAIIRAFPIEKEMALMSRIKKKNILTVAIALALSKMQPEMKDAMLKNCDINWSPIIPIVKGKLQYLTFSKIPFEKFITFCEDDKYTQKVKEPLEIVKKAISENCLLRGFLFATKLNIDFCQKLKENNKIDEMKIEDCISLMENELKDCQSMENHVKILRFFGSSMQAGGFCLISLATFIVLKDQIKIESVCIVDDSIIEKVKQYIVAFKDSNYKPILESVLKNLSSSE